MKSTFRTLFYLKKKQPKSNGLVPIIARITVNTQVVQFGCKLDIDPKIWNTKAGKAIGRSKEAADINTALDNLLRFFGNLHNAKYVCPIDLKAEHDKYVAKKHKADLQAEIEKQLEKEANYREAKEKFFGLVFSDGLISIRVLESVAGIITEGKAMHNCVSSYHSKEDSLILSACIDGKRIETIEISIYQLRVIQSRGVYNKNTKYHNQIINLVNQNISLIEERLTA